MDKNDLARILFNKSFDELDDSQKKTVLNFSIKKPEVGTPIKYDSNIGAIVNENTDQPASQNQILTYIKDNPLKVTAGTSLAFAAEEIPGAYKAARKLDRGRVRSALGITGALNPVLTTIGTPAMTALLEGAFFKVGFSTTSSI